MGRVGVSWPPGRGWWWLAHLLLLVASGFVIAGVFQLAGPGWACVATGVLLGVYALVFVDVDPPGVAGPPRG